MICEFCVFWVNNNIFLSRLWCINTHLLRLLCWSCVFICYCFKRFFFCDPFLLQIELLLTPKIHSFRFLWLYQLKILVRLRGESSSFVILIICCVLKFFLLLVKGGVDFVQNIYIINRLIRCFFSVCFRLFFYLFIQNLNCIIL